MNKKTIITNNFEETQRVGFGLAQELRGGEVLCLYGDLGFGKTTFIQGLARGLAVTNKVLSPTFIIMRSYEIQNSRFKIENFFHVDLYRMETLHDIEGLGLLELLGKQDTIVAIEWPEKLGKLLPEKRIDITLEYLDDGKRRITIDQK